MNKQINLYSVSDRYYLTNKNALLCVSGCLVCTSKFCGKKNIFTIDDDYTSAGKPKLSSLYIQKWKSIYFKDSPFTKYRIYS